MSTSKEHADFYLESARLEDALEAARAKLGPKGTTSIEDAAEFRAASDALASWRRDTKILAGRPMVVDAPTGAE